MFSGLPAVSPVDEAIFLAIKNGFLSNSGHKIAAAIEKKRHTKSDVIVRYYGGWVDVVEVVVDTAAAS